MAASIEAAPIGYPGGVNRIRDFLLLLCAGLFVFACAGTPPPDTTPAATAEPASEAEPGQPAEDAEPTPAAPEETAKTPARGALAWTLNALNERGGVVEEAEINERFAPAFLAQVPAAQVVQVFAALSGQLKPLKVESIAEGETDTALVAVLDTKAGPMRAIVRVEAEAPHKMQGLLFQPATPAEPKFKSFDEAADALEKVGATAVLYAARLDGATCTPAFDRNGGTAVAIGSAFKLYVLAALAEQVAAGKVSWDQQLEVVEERKSLPSGKLQDAPNGFKVTVADTAKGMIAISDNTATDMLIHLLGRKTIEKSARKLGNKRNEPFFTTRELFLFKLVVDDFQISRYRDKRKVAKRSYLNGKLRRTKLPPASALNIAGWDKPPNIDLEWFATAPELCRVVGALATASEAEKTAPLRDMLSANPGMAVDKSTWDYVGFKGGSEPGVLNLTFLLQRKDGARFVLVVGVNDSANAFDQAPILEVAGSAVDLLGKLE